MTNDTAAMLMNKYYDNEATDAELAALFAHLGNSPESRELFMNMKTAEDALMQPAPFDFPREIDESLSALRMDEPRLPFMNRNVSMSVSSAILSMFVVCLLSIVFFSMVSRNDGYGGGNEPQSAMNAMFHYGTVPHQANEN